MKRKKFIGLGALTASGTLLLSKIFLPILQTLLLNNGLTVLNNSITLSPLRKGVL